MKNIFSSVLAVAVLCTTYAVMLGFAEDEKMMPMEKTIIGTGMCAKCVLHQGTECQTIIQSQENGKTVTYYLVNNAVSKDFHKNVCTTKEQVKATGTVMELNGKQMLTASKLELIKDK